MARHESVTCHFMQYPDFMVNGRVVVFVSFLSASQGVFMESHKAKWQAKAYLFNRYCMDE